MATNPYFQQGVQNEQNLYESLIIESISIYGQDVFFLPRKNISTNDLLGEPDKSEFNSHTVIEMYIESFDGFGGEGNLFSKFGLEIRDQMNLIVSRKRFKEEVPESEERPRPFEGDLIYFPLSRTLFEIKFVEHEEPFYQLNNLPIYKLQLEPFEYSGESLDTGIQEIDQIEYTYGSGGIQMDVELVNIDDDGSSPLLTLDLENVLGKYYSQDSGQDGVARAKLYSITEETSDDSPITQQYTISLGQVSGIFNVSDTDFLIAADSDGDSPHSAPHQFRIKKIYDVNDQNIDEYADDDIFPGDKQADNLTIEKEADEIISFDETNPFGNF